MGKLKQGLARLREAITTTPRTDHRFGSVTLLALLPALCDVVRANLTVDFPAPSARLAHAGYDLLLTAALGLAFDAILGGLDRLGRRSVWAARIVSAGIFGALAYGLLERNFSRQASLLFDGAVYLPVMALLVGASGVGVTALVGLARLLAARPLTATLGVALAAGGAAANVVYFPDDYHEAHTAVASVVMIFAGTSLGAVAFARSAVCVVARLVAAAAVLAVVVAPANSTRLLLFSSPGGAGAWIASDYVWTLPAHGGEPPASLEARWLEKREQHTLAPKPPLHPAPVVVLLTIDAVRADVINDDERTKEMPTFTRLKREGVLFTEARSPGSQTSVSLTALFAGKYFSEMRWERFGEGKNRFEYAAGDTTPRLPELLGKAGVLTHKVVSLMFLRNEFGVASGFAQEVVVTEGRRHARGAEVVGPMLERLRNAGPEPLFMFAHLTEPHAPYDRGKLKFGPRFDRYLAEIALADQFVGQIVATLASPELRDRAILIVSSDHGEAFGEHGTYEHTKTIYDEMVRVPLMVWGRGVVPRRIDQRVTLMDVYPTVLELFGVAHADVATAESLVPLLLGQDPVLTRPILGEGRLRRSLVHGDLNVIVDLRRKTVEAFDLAADPLELDSFYDRDPTRAAPLLSALDRFFEQRGYHEGGYVPVYKP